MVEKAFIVTPRGEIQRDALPEDLLREDSHTLPTFPAGEIPEEIDLVSYTDQIAWRIMKAIYLDELRHGTNGIKKRVAARVGLHPVNGFTRKISQILPSCPHLEDEIAETLELS